MTEHQLDKPTQGKRTQPQDPTLCPQSTFQQSNPRMSNITQLQRLVGNRHVQTMLESDSATFMRQSGMLAFAPHLQRGLPLPNALQREGEGDTAPERADQTANIATLTRLRDNADRRFGLTNDYATKSAGVATSMKGKLLTISDTYREAYGEFRRVLDAAEEEAQNQQMWTGIIVGIGVGVAVGLLAAWAMPAAEAAAWTITAAEAATAVGSAAGQAAGGAAVSYLAMAGLDVEGQRISSEGLDPNIRELQVWRQVSNMYESGHQYNGTARELHRLTVNTANLIGDVRVYNEGGESELTDEEINSIISTLETADTELADIESELQEQIDTLDRIKETVDAIDPSSYTVAQMERDIWSLWMSSLEYDSNIIDIDEIEDHLGPEGLGMVDFGGYTSDEEEDEAIRLARVRATALQEEYDTMFNSDFAQELRDRAAARGGPVCVDPSMAGGDPAMTSDEPVCFDPDMGEEGGFRESTDGEEVPYCEAAPEGSAEETTCYDPGMGVTPVDEPGTEGTYEDYGPPMEGGYSTDPSMDAYPGTSDEENSSVYDPTLEENYSY